MDTVIIILLITIQNIALLMRIDALEEKLLGQHEEMEEEHQND